MATAASAQRESSAEMLKESIRQLRRYIDAPGNTKTRILMQKIDAVSKSKDQLILSHHAYGNKSDNRLDSDEMRNYIEPLIDSAVDILDEAEIIIDETDQEKEASDANREATAKRAIELSRVKIEVTSNSEVLRRMIAKLTEAVETEEPAETDVKYVLTIMSEIEIRENELSQAYHLIHGLMSDPAEINRITVEETDLRKLIYDARAKGQLFVSENQAQPNT